jgi:hypothetical protein
VRQHVGRLPGVHRQRDVRAGVPEAEGDVGHGVVILAGPVPAELAGPVAKAAANCPERAIVVS